MNNHTGTYLEARPARRPVRPVFTDRRRPRRAVSAALAGCSTRTLVIEAWADPESNRVDVEQHPVLAIKSTTFEDGSIEDDALIAHPAWPGLTEPRLACEGACTAWQLVPAPWPEVLDELKLAPIVERLKRSARRLVTAKDC